MDKEDEQVDEVTIEEDLDQVLVVLEVIVVEKEFLLVQDVLVMM